MVWFLLTCFTYFLEKLVSEVISGKCVERVPGLCDVSSFVSYFVFGIYVEDEAYLQILRINLSIALFQKLHPKLVKFQNTR